MTYPEVVDWLFQQVPNYQHQGGVAYKPGLDRTLDLLHAIGDPHKKIKTIHIAGTNGKGSVSHILAAIFQKHGYKTGLFTSPHIVDFRERIKINGEPISKEFVVEFFAQNKTYFLKYRPSFFEITTAMAFHAFAKNSCDISIIETGLGGRLDSTNVLTPELSIITNIGLDHTAFLGDTLELIAKEKAGIIKSGVPVVIGDCEEALYPVFEEKATELNSPITFSQNEASKSYETDLLGSFQQRNIHTAITATVVLKTEWQLTGEDIARALLNVQGPTNFNGRLQQISKRPKLILDAAHNKAGIENLLIEVGRFKFAKLRIVYGASNDKDWQAILAIFPTEAVYYFSEFGSARSVTLNEFQEAAESYELKYTLYGDVTAALNKCKSEAEPDDLILVCGSFYLMEKIK